jgi:DNA-binding transcriptional ArsR family regulator
MKSQASKTVEMTLGEKSQEVAALLKQLSHPQRLMILCSLLDQDLSVGEIERACGASQSSVSQFLKAMKSEGLVESERSGKLVFYRIKDKRVVKIIQSLYKTFCK